MAVVDLEGRVAQNLKTVIALTDKVTTEFLLPFPKQKLYCSDILPNSSKIL